MRARTGDQWHKGKRSSSPSTQAYLVYVDVYIHVSMNFKVEPKHLMSELKQDIWGKHEGRPKINKQDFFLLH